MNATVNDETAAAPGAVTTGGSADATPPARARAERVHLDADAESGPSPEVARPRTITVLGVLVAAALLLSYLGAYAFTNAMVSAELIKPWDAANDPRPKWLLAGFAGLMTVFVLLGAAFRFASRRQLQSIDATADAEDEFRIST
jgi:hypothetical protein